MAELIEAVVSWPTLLLAIGVFSLVPGVVLHLAVMIYPRDHPRRRELIADLAIVPRLERPFWVTEQLVTVIFEGVPLRVKVARQAISIGRSTRRRRRRRVGGGRRVPPPQPPVVIEFKLGPFDEAFGKKVTFRTGLRLSRARSRGSKGVSLAAGIAPRSAHWWRRG